MVQILAESSLDIKGKTQEHRRAIMGPVARSEQVVSMLTRVVTVAVLAILAAGMIVPLVPGAETEKQRLERGRASRKKEARRAAARSALDANPFDPEVPRWLFSSGEVVWKRPGSGRSELARRVEDRLRQRLARQPDPEIAWTLARVLQLHIRGGSLLWNTPAHEGRSHRGCRVTPEIHYGAMAEILERGFQAAPAEHPRRTEIAQGLAKIALLRGDWAAMNSWLEKLGQKPVPEAQRPWLTAPPKDFGPGLAERWTLCAEEWRTGDCALEITVHKAGRGLPGVHVLVRGDPGPRNGGGWNVATLLHGPHPLPGPLGFWDSFGYMGHDRARTRYAVTDASGTIHLEGLPLKPVLVEVLVPTGNFTEPGADWELLMEARPGEWQLPPGFAPSVRLGEARGFFQLREGGLVRCPPLVVVPRHHFPLVTWARAHPGRFTLTGSTSHPATMLKTRGSSTAWSSHWCDRPSHMTPTSPHSRSSTPASC